MWVRFDDQYPIHRKVAPLDDATYRLASEALFWCSRNLTDGRIAADELDAVSRRGQRSRAAKLVERGIWHPAGFKCDSEMCPPSGKTGWVIHDYLEYQLSRARVIADRGKAADRQRSFRNRHPKGVTYPGSSGGSNGVTNDSSNGPNNDSSNAPRNGVTNGRRNARSNSVSSGVSSDLVNLPHSHTPKSSSSPYVAVAAALELEEDDEDVRKVIELIQTEHAPDALGPYVRKLADNGDLPDILARIRGDSATSKRDEALAIVRASPPCGHGVAGGDLPHPDSGEPVCLDCRIAARKAVA